MAGTLTPGATHHPLSPSKERRGEVVGIVLAMFQSAQADFAAVSAAFSRGF